MSVCNWDARYRQHVHTDSLRQLNPQKPRKIPILSMSCAAESCANCSPEDVPVKANAALPRLSLMNSIGIFAVQRRRQGAKEEDYKNSFEHKEDHDNTILLTVTRR